MKHLIAVSALALALSGTAAFAQDGNKPNQNGANASGDLDATLTLLPENAQTPSAVTDEIQIPRQGIETANTARETASAESNGAGQSFGTETSANAKDKQDGESFGAATAAAAQAQGDNQDSPDSQDAQDGQDAFGQANAAAAQQLEDSARTFGDATSAAAQQEHEAFSQRSRPTQTPPDVQNLPAVQDLPAVQGPTSTPGKP